jgi:hypothetical protein
MSKQKKKSMFSPASVKQALMMKRASDTNIVVIGGAS